MKNLWLWACVVVRTSNMKISRRLLADYVKTLHEKACRTCSTIIFLHSTNQILDLWRCRGRCRCRFLNSLMQSLATVLFHLALSIFLPTLSFRNSISFWLAYRSVLMPNWLVLTFVTPLGFLATPRGSMWHLLVPRHCSYLLEINTSFVR